MEMVGVGKRTSDGVWNTDQGREMGLGLNLLFLFLPTESL